MDFLKIIRPNQWIKNLLVFLPMFFGGKLLCCSCWLSSIWAFVIFSVAASGIYSLNDAVDAKFDALHPKKKMRPVASGRVSVKSAIILFFILSAIALILTLFIPVQNDAVGSMTFEHTQYFSAKILCVATVAAYILINIGYSLGIKNISIVDTLIVAFGFVLRIALGGFACGIILSPWIIIMVFLLALFLVFAKRRDDLVIARNMGENPRLSSRAYNLAFLNQTLGILAAVIMVGYIMYCMYPVNSQSHSSSWLYVSSIFVLASLLRYLQITLVDEDSGNPTDLVLKDRFLRICGALWIISYLIILYI